MDAFIRSVRWIKIPGAEPEGLELKGKIGVTGAEVGFGFGVTDGTHPQSGGCDVKL